MQGYTPRDVETNVRGAVSERLPTHNSTAQSTMMFSIGKIELLSKVRNVKEWGDTGRMGIAQRNRRLPMLQRFARVAVVDSGPQLEI